MQQKDALHVQSACAAKRYPTRASRVQDKPYALFGTCLGAITAYEIARAVEREGNAPMPVALFPAAVSPPHLYALAVMKLYLTRPLGADEPPPLEEVMGKLRGWEQLPKETVMMVSSVLLRACQGPQSPVLMRVRTV